MAGDSSGWPRETPEESASNPSIGAPLPPVRKVRYRGFVLLMSAVILFVVGVSLGILDLEPVFVEGDVRVAEDFVNGLLMANAEGPGSTQPGYATAFSLLSPDLAEEVGYGGFVEDFDRIVVLHGPIEKCDVIGHERGNHTQRRLNYELLYGGHKRQTQTYELKLVLRRVAEKYRVASYDVARREDR